MRRPFETTCFLIDRKLSELDIDQEGNPVPITIDLSEVESYRPNNNSDHDDFFKEMLVIMKSGDSTVIKENYFEFKKIFHKSLLKRVYESIIIKLRRPF